MFYSVRSQLNNECFDKLMLSIGVKDASDTISAITRHLTSKASWVQDTQWVSFPDIRFALFGGGGKNWQTCFAQTPHIWL